MTVLTPTFSAKKPKAVLLDMDNTIYSYEPAHLYALEQVVDKASKQISMEKDRFLEAYEKAKEVVKGRLKNTASSHSRLLYFQKLLENLGLGSQFLLALDLEQTYWRAFLKKSELFDDVIEFLDDLRLKSIPVCIVTDLTAQIQFRKILYFGLDSFLDTIVTSEEVGADKPHENMFRLAMEKLNLKIDDPVWFVGDSLEKDILGSKKILNATAFQKVDGLKERLQFSEGADFRFLNFNEMREILKGSDE